jgi:1-acyl-sn-glycerol-3-phosphate acyltransferase
MSASEIELIEAKTIQYRAISGLVKFLSSVLFRPTVIGVDKIPENGPVVIAPVHRSNVDPVFTLFIAKRKIFFMAKDSLFKIDFLANLFRHLGAFPVARGTADRDSMAAAETVLRSGKALVLFPEGTRRSGNAVTDLHDGAMFVAARTQAVVVPVGIGGAERIMPKGAKYLRPTKVVVVIGDPIEPPSASDGGRIPRSLISAKTEELRMALQETYRESLAALDR